jgi:hypothetical protein
VQIIADAIRRHVPTASSDQIKDTAKEVVGRLAVEPQQVVVGQAEAADGRF